MNRQYKNENLLYVLSNSFLSETSVFKMGGKNDKLFLKTMFQKNKVPNGKGVWHEHIYYLFPTTV